jgi:hypothetical protein
MSVTVATSSGGSLDVAALDGAEIAGIAVDESVEGIAADGSTRAVLDVRVAPGLGVDSEWHALAPSDSAPSNAQRREIGAVMAALLDNS